MPDDDTDLHVRLARLEEKYLTLLEKSKTSEKKQDYVVYGLFAAAGSAILRAMGWAP